MNTTPPPGDEARELFPITRFGARFFHPAMQVEDSAPTADFRPRVLPADVEDPAAKHMDCKSRCSDECWAPPAKPGVKSGDPKVVGSSVTDSATHSGSGESANGSSESPTTTPTKTDPVLQSETTEETASVAKVAMLIPPSFLPPTLGILPGNGKAPAEGSGSASAQTPQTVTSSSPDVGKQETKQ